MEDNRRIQYKIILGLLLLTALSLIIYLSFSYNLNMIIEGPSEDWERDIEISDLQVLKITPSIHVSENSSEMLTTDGHVFYNNVIDRSTSEYTSKIISIPNKDLSKISDCSWDGNFIFWLENSTLSYSCINSDGIYDIAHIISKEVNSFKLLRHNDTVYLGVAENTGICLYEASNGVVSQISEKYIMSRAKDMDFVFDNSGGIHIAAYSDSLSTAYMIKYLTFSDKSWSLLSEKALNISGRFSMLDIEIGIDDTDAYILYTNSDKKSRGRETKALYTMQPLNKYGTEMNFIELNIGELDTPPKREYIYEPKFIKQQNDKLTMFAIKKASDKRDKEVYAIYKFTMNNGFPFDLVKVSNNKTWLSNLSVVTWKDDYILSFLQIDNIDGGIKHYFAYYTDSSSSYRKAASMGRISDFSYAALYTFGIYISSIFFITVKMLIFLPAIFLIVIMESGLFRNLPKKRRPLFVIVSFAVHIVTKLLTVNIHYTQLSIRLMPDFLKFDGSKYYFAIAITLLSFIISRLWKKLHPDVHYIADFSIFVILDVIISTMLYINYIA